MQRVRIRPRHQALLAELERAEEIVADLRARGVSRAQLADEVIRAFRRAAAATQSSELAERFTDSENAIRAAPSRPKLAAEALQVLAAVRSAATS